MIKTSIFEAIKVNVAHQEKLIEVLFKKVYIYLINKAIVEWTYVVIYSKLCYDLDKELPQKVESNVNITKTHKTSVTSVFRSKLLEKCRKIFKDDLLNLESYIRSNSLC